LVLSGVAGVVALPGYRMMLPNSMRVTHYPAIGHVNERGAGEVNKFGMDFKAAGYEWTKDLCEKDSDGDGETNGMELGDPCCIWYEGGGLPSRSWGLGHPGVETISTGFDNTTDPKADCDVSEQTLDSSEAFKKYYYSNGNSNEGNAAMKSGGNKFKTDISFEMMVEHFWVTLDTAYNDPRTVVDWFLPIYPKGSLGTGWNAMPMIRRITGPVMIFQWLYTVFCGGIAHQRTMGFWDQVKLAIAVFVYVDIHSVFLHVSLDNPMINDWPVIGAEAERFQHHHDEPNKVVTDSWLTFLSPLFMILPFATIFWAFHPDKPVLKTYAVYLIPAAVMMMCAHRWSHQVPHRIHPVVKALQHVGILISGEEHCLHHATYDRNFAIFSGITNPFFNLLTSITGEKHPIWVAGWAYWIVAPGHLMSVWKKIEKSHPNGHPYISVDNNLRRISVLLGGEDVASLTAPIAAKFAGIVGVSWTAVAVYGVYGFSYMFTHATVMGVAVCLAMSEGMLANVAGVKKTKMHKNAMRLSGLLLLVGVYAIVNHKWQAAGVRSLEALIPKSNHAWVGSVAFTCAFIQTWSGILKMGGNRFHQVLGKFTYYTCSAATVLGVDSMLNRGPHYFAIFGIILPAYYVAKARGELPAGVNRYFSGAAAVEEKVAGAADPVKKVSAAAPVGKGLKVE